MNELESYYNQSSQVGSALGMVQRGEVAQRQGRLGVQEAKDDIAGALTSEKEKTEQEGGGVGLGAGLLTKEGLEVAGKRLAGTATEKAREFIQSKVDVIKTAKDAGELNKVVGSGEYVAPPVGTTPLNSAPTASRTTNLARRAPDADDAADVDLTSTLNPTGNRPTFNQTRDNSDDFGNNPDVVAEPLGQEGSVFRRAFQSIRSTLSSNPEEDAVSSQLKGVSKITSQTMKDLGEKIGVKFDGLTTDEIGQSLGGMVGKTGLDATKIASGLGDVGEALGYVAPIAMVVGLGASIAGIFEAKKVNRDLINKSEDINTMTDNINTLGGMSFGSISNSAIDTSQFRSGGAGQNF